MLDRTDCDELRNIGKRISDVAKYLIEDSGALDSFVHIRDIRHKREEARNCLKSHKNSNQCEKHGCTGCHFLSGAIGALSDLLGESGIIK